MRRDCKSRHRRAIGAGGAGWGGVGRAWGWGGEKALVSTQLT